MEQKGARGFEQVDGQHYESNDIAAPVASNLAIRICFVLLPMTEWYAHLMDVKGAFLTGEFGNGEKLYMDVPQGFEQYYPKGWCSGRLPSGSSNSSCNDCINTGCVSLMYPG
jgi:hypothetical protein